MEKSTNVENVITVTFKEAYMHTPTTRTCVGMTKEQIIKKYGLNEDDIEWFEFV